MKVIRIKNPEEEIKGKKHLQKFNSVLESRDQIDSWINFDKEYTVYAISIYKEGPHYHISQEGVEYPWSFPAILFKITDQRVSKYWECALTFVSDESQMFISFNEMVNDSMFYEELIDGCKDRMEVFAKYRDLMDKEFMTEDELYHYEHDAIEIDKFGKVTSDSSFQYIKIITIDNTDGYFLSMYKGDDLENSVDDVWFDTYEELETYFDETKLVARWQESPVP
jgi:hypothetical protein